MVLKKIFNFVIVFLLCQYYLPLEKDVVLYLTNVYPSSEEENGKNNNKNSIVKTHLSLNFVTGEVKSKCPLVMTTKTNVYCGDVGDGKEFSMFTSANSLKVEVS